MTVGRATEAAAHLRRPSASVAAAVASAAFALGMALLGRPYPGIVHDAVVYIGQAMARVDPQGVGQDLMFRAEGQSGFTLFSGAAALLVGAVGPGPAAMAMGLAGLALWTLAAAALCRTIAPRGGAPAWICLAWMLVAPGAYGGLGVLHVAESFANPRPFAEAAVLAGLTFFVRGRPLWAAALLAAAALVHPLIAVAGFGAVWVMLAIGNRRWLWPGLAGAIACLGAAALGLPVASRLFEAVDPAWRAVIELRNPYLMPALWRAQDWARLLAQFTTLIVAFGAVENRVRPLLIGAAATAALGTGVSLFASFAPSLLLLQLQTWRAAWLLAALSAALTPVLVVALFRRGGAGRLLLALVAIGQLATSVPAASAIAALLALVIVWGEHRGWRIEPRRSLVITVWLAFALIVAGGLAGSVIGLGQQAAAALRFGVPLEELNRGGVLAAAAAVLVGMRLLAEGRLKGVWRISGLAAIAAAALGLGLFSWDARSAFARAIETGHVDRSPFSPGPLLWLPDEALVPLATGRPAWLSRVQGAGNIFSRPLAIEWSRRVDATVGLGLADRAEFAPDVGAAHRKTSLPIAAVEAACAIPSGPATLVVDRSMLAALPPDARLWTAPAPIFDYSAAHGPRWERRDVFAVVRCR